MIKKLLQTILVTSFTFSSFSCIYRNCDEDCAIGHSKAICADHPKTECDCFNKFRTETKSRIPEHDQNR